MPNNILKGCFGYSQRLKDSHTFLVYMSRQCDGDMRHNGIEKNFICILVRESNIGCYNKQSPKSQWFNKIKIYFLQI